MKLGILDQIPLPCGASVQDTFRKTIKLAQHAEAWGYSRYCLAEHHNTALWVLGLSEQSGRIAAERGLGLTFGHFISPDHWHETLSAYRTRFRPSSQVERPIVNACVSVVCAKTTERAEELALTQDHWLLGIERGDTKIPSLEDIQEKQMTSNTLVNYN